MNDPDWCCGGNCNDDGADSAAPPGAAGTGPNATRSTVTPTTTNATSTVTATPTKKMCAAWTKPQVVEISTNGRGFQEVLLDAELLDAGDRRTDGMVVITTGDIVSEADELNGFNLPDIKVVVVGTRPNWESNQLSAARTGTVLSQYPMGASSTWIRKHVHNAQYPEMGCCVGSSGDEAGTQISSDSGKNPDRWDNSIACRPECKDGCWGFNYDKKTKRCMIFSKPIVYLKRQNSYQSCRCYVKKFDADVFGPFGELVNPPSTTPTTATGTAAAAATTIAGTAAASTSAATATVTAAATTAAAAATIPQVEVDCPSILEREECKAVPAACRWEAHHRLCRGLNPEADTPQQTTAALQPVRTTAMPTHPLYTDSEVESSWEFKTLGIITTTSFVLAFLAVVFVKHYKQRARSYSTLLETGKRMASVVHETSMGTAITAAALVASKEESPLTFAEEAASTVHPASAAERSEKIRWIARSDINLIETMQNGSFGEIVKAQLTLAGEAMYTVAVKRNVLKNDAANMDDEFLAEGMLMSQFSCKFVLGLVGVSTTLDMNEVWLVLEYCEFGSLYSQLRPAAAMTPPSSAGGTVRTCRHVFATLKGKLQAALEIVTGMAFLESHKCIHRDLASRNVLVSSSYECKIADFGLSRCEPSFDLTRGCYVSEAGTVALRWGAPECISLRRFSSASDVWAFGVLMCELFTNAELPYQSVPDAQLVLAICDESRNFRMDKPPTMPVELYTTLVTPCWAHASNLRPTFGALKQLVPVARESKPGAGGSNVYSAPFVVFSVVAEGACAGASVCEAPHALLETCEAPAPTTLDRLVSTEERKASGKREEYLREKA